MNSPAAANRFRIAIRRGAYAEAEQLLEELRCEVETIWRAAVSRQERNEIASEITALLNWAQQTVTAGRSHAQTKLVRLNRQKAYLITGANRRELVRAEG
jgi:hypothetical protein